MRKILIATHGNFAEGIRSAAELILGPQNMLYTICAYIENISLKDELQRFFEECEEEDEVIILTDIFGGSVNQACIPFLQRDRTSLLTGINLALLLNVLTQDEGTLSAIKLEHIATESREQTRYVNLIEKAVITDDFE